MKDRMIRIAPPTTIAPTPAPALAAVSRAPMVTSTVGPTSRSSRVAMYSNGGFNKMIPPGMSMNSNNKNGMINSQYPSPMSNQTQFYPTAQQQQNQRSIGSGSSSPVFFNPPALGSWTTSSSSSSSSSLSSLSN